MFLAYSYNAVFDFREFNKHIKFCVNRRKILNYLPQDESKLEKNEYIKNMSHRMKAYLVVGDVKIELYYTDNNGKNQQYTIFLDLREVVPQTSPATTMSAFSNTTKGDILENKFAPACFSASPILGYNPKYSGQRLEAFGYDLNSAYASIILDNEWANFNAKPVAKMIDPETEIGFDLDYNIKREGYSIWVFKKCPVPQSVIRYFEKHYKAKQEAGAMYKATGDKQWLIIKQKEKDMLNFPIGCLQNKNPFVRAWIVGKTNEKILSLIDEDTLFWNTDSIVSRRRREDLEENMGDGLGQWKLEHEGVVAYVGNNYQWNQDIPTYRGIPKSWFPKDYDILKHGTPFNRNVLAWDWEKMEIYEVKQEDLEWQVQQ